MSILQSFNAETDATGRPAFLPRRGHRVDPALLARTGPFIVAVVVLMSALPARHLCSLVQIGGATGTDHDAVGIAIIAACLALGMLHQAGLFDFSDMRGSSSTAIRGLAAMSGTFLLLEIMVLVLDIGHRYPTSFLLIWFLLSSALAVVALSWLALWRRRLIEDGQGAPRVVIYGESDVGCEAAIRLTAQGAIIVDVLCDELADLAALVAGRKCDRVVIAARGRARELVAAVLARLEAEPIEIQLCLDVSSPGQSQPGARSDIHLVCLQRSPLAVRGMIWKTALDYTVAAVALVALSPLMLLIAIAIKLDSRGPVFFVQARGGYRHRAINVFKFRSMTVMENGARVEQARPGDHRVTRVGRFLRRTSLDELPQLLNVLRGELSLVGPRPHALAHDEYYGRLVDHYAGRLRMKPGITGWAQVNGLRCATADPELMRQRVQHDLYYIENWSLGLDVVILVRTLGVMLWDKAY